MTHLHADPTPPAHAARVKALVVFTAAFFGSGPALAQPLGWLGGQPTPTPDATTTVRPLAPDPPPALAERAARDGADPRLQAALAAYAHRHSGAVSDDELVDRVGAFAFFFGGGPAAGACPWAAAAPGLGACVTPSAIAWTLASPDPDRGPVPDGAAAVFEEPLREVFIGVNRHAALGADGAPVGALDDRRGPAAGHRHDLPLARAVRLTDLWPGVDLVLERTPAGYKRTGEVAPGGAAHLISHRFDGAHHVEVTPDGELVVFAERGHLIESAPIAWQPTADGPEPVDAAWAVDGVTARLFLGAYDPSLPLIIDPHVSFQTSFSGVNGLFATLRATVRAPGPPERLILGGTISIPQFTLPILELRPKASVRGSDGYLVVITPAAASVRVVLLGGTRDDGQPSPAHPDGWGGSDHIEALATSPDGRFLYIAGATTSTDFPIPGLAFQRTRAGSAQLFPPPDAFVARLDLVTDALDATLYGGQVRENVEALVVLRDGTVVIGASTTSFDYPLPHGAPPHGPSEIGTQALVVAFSPDLTQLLGVHPMRLTPGDTSLVNALVAYPPQPGAAPGDLGHVVALWYSAPVMPYAGVEAPDLNVTPTHLVSRLRVTSAAPHLNAAPSQTLAATGGALVALDAVRDGQAEGFAVTGLADRRLEACASLPGQATPPGPTPFIAVLSLTGANALACHTHIWLPSPGGPTYPYAIINGPAPEGGFVIAGTTHDGLLDAVAGHQKLPGGPAAWVVSPSVFYTPNNLTVDGDGFYAWVDRGGQVLLRSFLGGAGRRPGFTGDGLAHLSLGFRDRILLAGHTYSGILPGPKSQALAMLKPPAGAQSLPNEAGLGALRSLDVADLTVTPTHPDRFGKDAPVVLTYTIKNAGPRAAPGTKLTLAFTGAGAELARLGFVAQGPPAGCSLPSEAAATLVCELGQLSRGETAPLTVTLPPFGFVTKLVVNASVTSDRAPADELGAVKRTIAIGGHDLALTAVVEPDRLGTGAAATLRLTARNNGPDAFPATGRTVTVTGSPTVAFPTLPPICSAAAVTGGHKVTCTLGAFAPGVEEVLSLGFTAPGEPGKDRAIDAVAIEDPEDIERTNDKARATYSVDAAELVVVDAVAAPDPIAADETTTLSVTWRNAGLVTAEDGIAYVMLDGLALGEGSTCAPVSAGLTQLPILGELIGCPLGAAIAPGAQQVLNVPVKAPAEPASKHYLPKIHLMSKGFDPAKKSSPLPSHAEIPVCVGCVKLVLAPQRVRYMVGEAERTADGRIPSAQAAGFSFTLDNTSRVKATGVVVDFTVANAPQNGHYPLQEVAVQATRQGAEPVVCPATGQGVYRCTLPEVAGQTTEATRWTLELEGWAARGSVRVSAAVTAQTEPQYDRPPGSPDTRQAFLEAAVDTPGIGAVASDHETPLKVATEGPFLVSVPNTAPEAALAGGAARLTVNWKAGEFTFHSVRHVSTLTVLGGGTTAVDAPLVCAAIGDTGFSCPLPRLEPGTVSSLDVRVTPRVAGYQVVTPALTLEPAYEATLAPVAASVRVRGADLSFEAQNTVTAVGKVLEAPPTLKNTGVTDATLKLRVTWDPADFNWEGQPPCGTLNATAGTLECDTALPAGQTTPVPWSLRARKRSAKSKVTLVAETDPAGDEETPADNTKAIDLVIEGPDLTLTSDPQSTPTPVGELVEPLSLTLKNQHPRAEARGAGFSYQWDPAVFRWEGTFECAGASVFSQEVGTALCRYTAALEPEETRLLPWSFRVISRNKAKQTITAKAIVEPLTDDEDPTNNDRPLTIEVAPADLRLLDGFDLEPPALKVGEPRIDTPLLAFKNAGQSRIEDIELTCTWVNKSLDVKDVRVTLPGGSAQLCPLETEAGKVIADCLIPGPIEPDASFQVNGTVTGLERVAATQLSCWARSKNKFIEDNLVDNAPSTTFTVEGVDARIVFNEPSEQVIAGEDTLLGAELRVVGEGAVEGAKLYFDTPSADAAISEVAISGGAGACTTDATTGRVTCPVPKLVEGSPEIVSLVWRGKVAKDNVPLTVSWDPTTVPKLASTAKPSETLSLSPRGVRFEPSVTVTIPESSFWKPAVGHELEINATLLNTGPKAAEDVVLEIDHDIPAGGFAFVAAPGCAFDSGTQRYRCEIAELAQNATVTRSLRLRADRKVPKFMATAFVKNGDPKLVEALSKSSAEANSEIQGADLVPIVAAPDELMAGGDQGEVTVTVFNAGPGKATTPGFELSYDDSVHELAVGSAACEGPTAVTGAQAGHNAKLSCRWQGEVLARAEATENLVLYFKGKKPRRQASMSVRATQVPEADEQDKTNDTVPKPVPVRGADLEPSAAVPQPKLGRHAWTVVTIVVTNHGKAAVTDGVLIATLPGIDQVEAVTPADCNQVNGGSVRCTGLSIPAAQPELPGNNERRFDFRVRINGGDKQVTLQLETQVPNDGDEETANDKIAAFFDVEGPDLAVDGTGPTDVWGVGQTRDVAVTLENLGPGLAQTAKFTMTWDAAALETHDGTGLRLPTGCAVKSAASVECDYTNLAPPWTQAVTLDLRAKAPRTKTEIRVVAATVPEGADPRAGNNLKLIPVTIKGRDLRASATVASEVRLGRTTQLVATVTNASAVAVDDVDVDVVVDANLRLPEPLPGGCTARATGARCQVGTLAANASQSFTFSLEGHKATPSGTAATVTVMALPTEGDDTPLDNSAPKTVRVVGPDLSVTTVLVESPNGEVNRGETVTLRATVTNTGAKANKSEIILQFPRQQLDYKGHGFNGQTGDECSVSTAAPDRVRCTVVTLADPQHPDGDPTSKTFDFEFRAKGYGPATGEVEVRPTTPNVDDDPNDNKSPFSVDVEGADLALSPVGSPAFPKAGVGFESLGTYVLTNAGPGESDPSTKLRVLYPSADLKLVEVALVGNARPCQPDGAGWVACTLEAIAANAAPRHVTVRFEGLEPGLHPVTIEVAEDFPDEQPGDNSRTADVEIEGADLGVTLLAAPATLSTQQQATFTATVTNHGPMTADNARLFLTLPAGLRYDLATVDGAPRCAAAPGGQVACSLGDASQQLFNQQSTTVTLIATATATGAATVTAAASSDTGDPGGAPDSAQATVTVSQSSDSDGDGVPDADEHSAPGGDGNGDGVPDAQQPHVASVKSPQGHVATIEAPPGTLVKAASVVAPQPWPPGVGFPMDALELEIPVPTPGALVTIKVFFPWSVPLWAFWKYAPTTPGGAPTWWEFSWDGTTGARVDPTDPNVLLVTLQDGGRGDADGLANGVVKDPLAPALPRWRVTDAGDAPDASPGDGTCATAGGACTLRAALMEANASDQPALVDFALSGVPGQLAAYDIVLHSALPDVTVPLVLDASRAAIARDGLLGLPVHDLAIPNDPYPDPVFTAEMLAWWPAVRLTPARDLPGSPAAFSGPLLTLTAPRSAVVGLALTGADGPGVAFTGERCLVSRVLGLQNLGPAVDLPGATACRVADSVLLGPTAGLVIDPASPWGGVRATGGGHHAVVDNAIGLIPGTTRRGRTALRYGVALDGAAHVLVAFNRVADALHGVDLTGAAHDNDVRDNVFGLNSAGAISRYVLGRRDGVGVGVQLRGAAHTNRVHATAIPNAATGLLLDEGAHHNALTANRVGTLPSGACPADGPGYAYLESCSGAEIMAETCPTAPPGCGDVITTRALALTGGAHDNTVGGPAPGDGNALLGGLGVELTGGATADNLLENNAVGVQPPLDTHGRVGVIVRGGADNRFVGGHLASITVDGRLEAGADPVRGTAFEGVRVGHGPDGELARTTRANAVEVLGASDTLIADARVAPGADRTLSLFDVDGLVVRDTDLGVDPRGLPVRSPADAVYAFGGGARLHLERVRVFAAAGAGVHVAYDKLAAPSTPIGVYALTLVDSVVGATAALPTAGHDGHGLRLEAPGVYVLDGNLIGGNGAHGVWLHANSGWDFEGHTFDARLTTNAIGVTPDGLTPLPNGGAGVVVWDFVGGPVVLGGDKDAADPAPLGNLIAHNGGHGVLGVAGGPLTARGNRFFQNGGLPLTLAGPDAAGPLPNDPGDADAGPINGWQNHPVPLAREGLTMTGTLDSRAGTYVIDAYAVLDPDPSGHGEGSVWLGSTPLTLATAGAAPFSLTLAAEPPPNATLTTMATVVSGAFPGATSEQGPSRCLAEGAPNLTTSIVFTRDGAPTTSIPLGPDCGGSGCAVFQAQLRVDNAGDAPASDVTATLRLPPEVVALPPLLDSWGSGWSCDVAGDLVTCAYTGTLAASATAVALVRIEGQHPGEARFEADAATAAVECTTFDNPSAATLLVAPRPYLVELVPLPASSFVGQGVAGAPVRFTARVTHGTVTGDPGALRDVELTVRGDGATPVAGDDAACAAVGDAVRCAWAELPPDIVLDVPVALRFATAGQPQVHAALTASAPPVSPADTADSGLASVLAAGADLAVTLDGPRHRVVEVGEPLSFVFTLENVGTTTASNVAFTGYPFQQLPGHAFTLVDGQGAETCWSDFRECGLFTLAPGAKRTITVTGAFTQAETRTFSAAHNQTAGDVQLRNDFAEVTVEARPATGCPPGDAPFGVFTDDAEVDRGVFTAVPTYAQRLWVLGGAHSGDLVWQLLVQRLSETDEAGGVLATVGPYALPASATRARFGFWRWHRLAWQGANAHAVIEYALGAGPHAEGDWVDAMPYAVEGASTTTTPSGPFAGRLVFAGNSPSDPGTGANIWTWTAFDLDHLAGEQVALRVRSRMTTTFGSATFLADDLSLSGCEGAPAPPATLTVTLAAAPAALTVGDATTLTATATTRAAGAATLTLTTTAALPLAALDADGAACAVETDALVCRWEAPAEEAQRTLTFFGAAELVADVAVVADLSLDVGAEVLAASATRAVAVVAAPVPDEADLAVSLVASGPMQAGVAAFTLSLDNLGPAASGPARVRVTAEGAGAVLDVPLGCDDTGAGVRCEADLQPEDASSWPFTVTAATTGLVAVTAEVDRDEAGAAPADPDPANDAALLLLVHEAPAPPSADLAVALAVTPSLVEPGGAAVVDATVTNAGPDAAPAVALTAVAPLDLALDLDGTPCARAGETITCALGALPALGAAAVSWPATVTADGTLMALVTSDALDPAPSDDLAVATFGVIPPQPAPALTLTLPPSVLAGTPLVAAVRVDNLGGAPTAPTALEVSVDDLLVALAGPGCAEDGPGRARCALDPMAPGDGVDLAVSGVSDRPGPLAVSVRLVDGAAAPVAGGLVVRPIVRDRALSGALPTEVPLDVTQTVALGVTVTGEGPAAETALVVTATGAALEALDGRCAAAGDALVCALALAPGASDPVAVGWRPLAAGLATLTARLDPDPADADPSDDEVALAAVAVAPVANLAVAVGGPATLTTGAAVSFPVVVSNPGATSRAGEVTVTVSGATATGPVGCEADPDGALVCAVGPVAPGDSATVPVLVTAEATGAVVVLAALAVGGDDDPSDDVAARFAFASDPPRDLSVAIGAPADGVRGEPVPIEVAVLARSAASEVVVRLVAAGVLGPLATDDGRCGLEGEGGDVLVCALGALEAGATVAIDATAAAATPGEGQLRAEVAATGPSASPEDDVALATVAVADDAALTLAWEAPGRVDGPGVAFAATVTAELAPGAGTVSDLDEVVLIVTAAGAALETVDPRCAEQTGGGWVCLLDPEALDAAAFVVIAADVAEVTLTATATTVGLAGALTGEAEAVVRVAGPEADLAVTGVTVVDGAPLQVGVTAVVVAEVSHLGGDAVVGGRLGWRLEGAVPAALEDAGGGCVPDGPSWSCPVAPLADGEVAEVALVVTPSEEGALSLVAAVTSEAFDPLPANDEATLAAAVGRVVADRAVALSGPATLMVGAEGVFTVTLSQSGPAAAAPVGASVLLGPGLVLEGVAPAGACGGGVQGGAVSCLPALVGLGGEREIALSVRAVAPGVGAVVTLVSGAVEDLEPANDAAVAVVAVTADCAALACEASGPCAVASCAPLTGCVEALAADGAACDAGPCVVDAVCAAGACLGAARVCDGAASCQVGACDPELGCVLEDAPVGCDDGDACTAVDLCVDGACVGFEALACDDGDPCTADACGVDGCEHAPIDGGACDAGVCATGGVCAGGVCVGAPLLCDDADPCTVDGCGPGGCEVITSGHPACAGECAPARFDGACDEGDVVWRDACGAFGEVAAACDDGDPATDDVCDAERDLCVRRLGDGRCACDGAWEARCEGGALLWFDPCGVVAGVADACVSDDPCVASACDEARSACVQVVVDDAACRPAVACGAEAALVCEAGSLVWRDGCGEAGGEAVVCDEARPWTAGACDEAAGACVWSPTPAGLPECFGETVEPGGDVGPGEDVGPGGDVGVADEGTGAEVVEGEGGESTGCGGCAGGGSRAPWPALLLVGAWAVVWRRSPDWSDTSGDLDIVAHGRSCTMHEERPRPSG